MNDELTDRDIIRRKNDQIDRLKLVIEELKRALKDCEHRHEVTTNEYRNLKSSCRYMGLKDGFTIHMEALVQHYQNMFEQLLKDSIRKDKKYGAFYKEWEERVKQ